MSHFHAFTVLFLVTLWGAPSLQATLTPEAKFYRCYSLLTGKPPAFDNPHLQNVRSKQISPIQACRNVLDKVELDRRGQLKDSSEDSLMTFRNFNKLHDSWFMFKAIPNNSGSLSHQETVRTYDLSDRALYLTRSLFSPEVKLGSIFKSGYHLRAQRTSGSLPHQRAERGPLTGIRKEAGKNTNIQLEGKKFVRNYFSHPGGGVLGSQAYILASLIENYSYRSDGVVEVPRIWAVGAFKDMLCRHQPLIRRKDIPPLEKAVPHRSTKTCLKCHSTIDTLSTVIGNVYYAQSPNDILRTPSERGYFHPFSAGFHKAELPALSRLPKTPDQRFHKRRPGGRLYFRNYKGNLIDEEIRGIKELGEYLNSSVDAHLCVVSRYYEHFTGVKASFRSDGELLKNKTFDTLYNLSLDLMKHGDLRKTVGEILLLSDAKGESH